MGKKRSLAKINDWQKAGLLNKTEMPAIQERFQNNIYSPSLIMSIFLFGVTVLGIQTVLGPIALIIDIDSEQSWRLVLLVVGIASLYITETKFIKKDHHFRSGVIEAGYYVGSAFIYLGILGFDIDYFLIYLVVAFVFLTGISIRYVDFIALIAAVICSVLILFNLFDSVLAYVPFIIMLFFTGLFLVSNWIQRKGSHMIWEDHFVIFDSMALLLVYLGGNYFIVRELSLELMSLNLSAGEDIPLAFLFYVLTAILPIGYLTWGVIKRSVLFLRVGLFIVALTVLTLEYYHPPTYPEISIAIIGGVMILLALVIMKYLKKIRNGYTREQIIAEKWENSDLVALVASQTLGGHQIEATPDKMGKGGEFGGGGASGEY